MHGWPGSVFEFIEIINQLAHPEKYGGNKKIKYLIWNIRPLLS